MKHRRRFAIALGLSLVAHVLLLATLPRKAPQGPQMGAAPPPLTVRIEPVTTPAEPRAAAPAPAPAPPPPRSPPPRPAAKTPLPPPRIPSPRIEPPPEAPPPIASAPPSSLPPPPDMLAMIEQRRGERAAEEAKRPRPPVAKPPEDAASRNLATLTGREGVGGVFQILRKGTRTGEFAFNGWRPEARSQWREVYEVDAGLNGNVELAMVRRMIQLIRSHYKDDFRWESHRLDRVVVLSARLADTEGLEDFLMREFFGAPPPRPAR